MVLIVWYRRERVKPLPPPSTDLPESAPVLDGAKTSYQLGEQVTVNCTSLYSKPAATLEWFINDELVVSAPVIRDGCGR